MNTWYENKQLDGLDLNKPIMCVSTYNIIPYVELLVPQKRVVHDDDYEIYISDYNIVGYDWLNVQSGKYNSTMTFKTVEQAIKSRAANGGKLFNYDFPDGFSLRQSNLTGGK